MVCQFNCSKSGFLKRNLREVDGGFEKIEEGTRNGGQPRDSTILSCQGWDKEGVGTSDGGSGYYRIL